MQSALLGVFSTSLIFKPCAWPGPETDSFEAAAKNKSCFEYEIKTLPINYTHSSIVQNQHKLIQSRCLGNKYKFQEEQSPIR